jgi:tRNA modification GTPase
VNEADTITAIASPRGSSARGIVRLSGPRTFELLPRVFGPVSRIAGRVEGHVTLGGWPRVAASGWLFVAPRSYTREDACELHVPGSLPFLAALSRALEEAGARRAGPGEFTRRAFLNGRIDLAQAEAVSALANAEHEGEARAAARALLFGLGRAIDSAKSLALDALAHVETTIDFPEEDLPGLAPSEAIAARVEKAIADLSALERGSFAPRVSRSEPVVVLAGAANAGKSTLLNALAGREAALVSPRAGTTRDPVSAVVALGPTLRARFYDTAGEKEVQDAIERDALDRSRALAKGADLVAFVVDLGAPTGTPPEGALVVGAKRDLGGEAVVDVRVSALTGEGIPELRAALASRLERQSLSTDLVQTERQASLVRAGREALGRAAGLLRTEEPARLELSAVDLRAALAALGELTGAVATDDLLDRIFSQFCIGK